MSLTDDETKVVYSKLKNFDIGVKCKQKCIKEVSLDWMFNRPEDYNKLLDKRETGIAYSFGLSLDMNTDKSIYNPPVEGVEFNGIDESVLSKSDELYNLVREFYMEVTESLIAEIQALQRKSGFNPKEFIAFCFYLNQGNTFDRGIVNERDSELLEITSLSRESLQKYDYVRDNSLYKEVEEIDNIQSSTDVIAVVPTDWMPVNVVGFSHDDKYEVRPIHYDGAVIRVNRTDIEDIKSWSGLIQVQSESVDLLD